MKSFIKQLLPILLLLLTACKEDPTEQSQTYSVSGTIVSNGVFIPNATVSLDKRVDLTSASDSNGHFSIPNVPEGNYTLTAEKVSPDASFQSQTTPISVSNDVNITALILPRGVKIEQPTNVMATVMTLNWNPTDANDFREYKLYRHNSSGLDENSGTLIHVFTTINDTSFDDTNLNPLTKYYYRVYIMNDYGKLGGSNIVSATTQNINLIPDGGFEDSSAFSNNWEVYDTTGLNPVVSVSREDKYTGISSLHFTFSSLPSGGGIILHSKGYFPVVANTVYEVSCMVKINGIRSNLDDGSINIFQGAQFLKSLYTNGAPTGQSGFISIDWTRFSTTFVAPTNTSIWVDIFMSNESIWLDDLTIQPVQ